MKAHCLASSSAGNCYILEFEGMPPIMVECGIPYSKILQGCNAQNLNLRDIKYCLITHAHKDHYDAAKDLNMRGVKIMASPETLEKIKVSGQALNINVPNKIVDGLMVLPFKVDHDIEGAVGFIIKTKQECVIFVNDHKRWEENLYSFKPDYVFIECNYEHVMVYTQYHNLKKLKKNEILSEDQLKEVNVKLAQFERNINSHCSLKGTLVGLSKLNLSRCRTIFLMHLSDRYANEYKMKNEVYRKYGIETLVCQKRGGIK